MERGRRLNTCAPVRARNDLSPVMEGNCERQILEIRHRQRLTTKLLPPMKPGTRSLR